MRRSISLALMEAENARRAAERAGRPALHPMAEYYGDWERECAGDQKQMPAERSMTFSLNGEEG